MNKVTVEPTKRLVGIEGDVHAVELEVVHIESDYYYLQSSQVADVPKERE